MSTELVGKLWGRGSRIHTWDRYSTCRLLCSSEGSVDLLQSDVLLYQYLYSRAYVWTWINFLRLLYSGRNHVMDYRPLALNKYNQLTPLHKRHVVCKVLEEIRSRVVGCGATEGNLLFQNIRECCWCCTCAENNERNTARPVKNMVFEQRSRVCIDCNDVLHTICMMYLHMYPRVCVWRYSRYMLCEKR